MFGLSKKKGGIGQTPGGPRIPTERVVSLSSQGLSEPEIIRSLRDEGYSPLEVDRAMKQALRSGAGLQMPPPPPLAGPMGRMDQGSPQFGFPPSNDVPQRGMPPPPGRQQGFSEEKYTPNVWDMNDDVEDDLDKPLPKERAAGPDKFLSGLDDDLPPIPERPDKGPLPFTEPPLPKDRDDRTRELKDRRRREMEELAEEITDEKSQEVVTRMQALEDKVERIASAVKGGLQAGSGSGASPADIEELRKDIEDYKHSIDDTNARIDSLEDVVKNSLTPMIESVKRFSSAVRAPKPVQGPPQQFQPQRPPV